MWSEKLINLTKEIISIAPSAYMKNLNGKFGMLKLYNSKFIITEHKENKHYFYNSIDELLADGWVVD